MNIVRTTELAIGASLIGSSLFMAFTRSVGLSYVITITGLLFLLHGTGFLHEYMIRVILSWYRTKKPAIGIIADLPWLGTHGCAWSRMGPKEWLSRMNDTMANSETKAEIKLIRVSKPWTRWFLDRYAVIINPYGSTYPETDTEDLSVMRSILSYVQNGGMFVNVADIPFFFAHDPKRSILYCAASQDTHLYKKLVWQLYGLQYGQNPFEMPPPYPYVDTPFLKTVNVNIVATETRGLNSSTKQTGFYPMYGSLCLKEGGPPIEDVAIHRGIVGAGHVESIVEELEWELEWTRMRFTPLCYINYGKGRILASLLFLECTEQADKVRDKITNLQFDLVIKGVSDMLRRPDSDHLA